MIKKILLFIILTTIFSFLIFILRNYFFGDLNTLENKKIEENFIEKTKQKIPDLKSSQKQEIIERLKKEKKSIVFRYFPKTFKEDIWEKKEKINYVLNSKIIEQKIKDMEVFLYKKLFDVRGKMKNKSIRLFGVENIQDPELISVAIHELAHYIDLYFLEKSVFKDISNYFYEISWDTTKIIKPGQKNTDFVSGYAMTNKYEDFAESLTYYILHNKNFLEKSKKSKILEKKYRFFKKNLFRNDEFVDVDYTNDEIKDYYWDITKIDYNLKKFLHYLKK